MDQKIITIRNRIGDTSRVEVERYVGNGTKVDFSIQHKNPFNIVITVDGEVVDDTAYTYDAEIDKIIFTTAPADGLVIVIKYKWAAFTDTEYTAFLNDKGGDIDGATVEALRQMIGSQARMVTFQQGDRSVSMTDIFNNFMKLLDYYEKLVTNAGANSGSGVIMGRRTMDEPRRRQEHKDLSRLIGYEE